MTLLPLNGALIALVALTSIGVIAYWWYTTRGSWMDWPAGRSLMGLLAILAVVTGWAATNVLFLPRDYPGKSGAYLFLYVLLELAVIVIGLTIHKEMRIGRSKQQHPSNHHFTTGTIDIVVATELKEDDHV